MLQTKHFHIFSPNDVDVPKVYDEFRFFLKQLWLKWTYLMSDDPFRYKIEAFKKQLIMIRTHKIRTTEL